MADDKPANSQGIPPGAVSAEPMNLPPIPLDPAAAKKVPPPTTPPVKPVEIKDTFRELIETIVFVVVLVLMLKTFLAEAFVIPTGSMADTLLGYHFKVRCVQCGKENLVNASSEAEAQPGIQPARITKCECQNCGYLNTVRDIGGAGQ
ncbi:MAG TPA: hypothetical protein VFE62_10590 [Gemmataceae bacterium]|nr:hypothetical protein [Gemmataceae bacterium]